MKTNIQTIFIDLDNTLYDHASQIVPPLHIQALHALKAKGGVRTNSWTDDDREEEKCRLRRKRKRKHFNCMMTFHCSG